MEGLEDCFTTIVVISENTVKICCWKHAVICIGPTESARKKEEGNGFSGLVDE